MRDSMFDDTAARLTLPMATRTDGTAYGYVVDRADAGQAFQSAMLLVIVGDVADGSCEVTLQESDADSSGWADVRPEHLQGGPIAVDDAWAGSVQRLGYTGSKRYLRVSATTSDATVGGTMTAVLLLSQGTGSPIT